jgi:hypothetical protein
MSDLNEYYIANFKSQYCEKFNPTFDNRICAYYDAADNQSECGFCKQPNFTYRCIADTGRILPLSYSLVQNYLTCHWMGYLINIRGIRIKDSQTSKPLKMGMLWDKVLQKHLGGKNKNGSDINIPALIEQYEIEDREVSKVKALFRAYKDLEIKVDEGGVPQAPINYILKTESNHEGSPISCFWGDIKITGYYDCLYDGYFAEDKLSGRPDNYLDPSFIQSQVGTYFLVDESLKYCVMRVVRVPDLKSTGSHKDEDDDIYQERCYQDIISRPSRYFIGWSTERKTYGRKFMRSEFDLEEIKHTYQCVAREIQMAWTNNWFYKESRSCGQVFPGIPCDLKTICRYNKFNDGMFEIRRRD